MKIYVVIVKDGEDVMTGCDWIGDDPYELEKQEVFFDKEQAVQVFNDVNKHGTTYEVSLHEFEV